MSAPLLKVADLCAGYGRSQVLFGLSLDVPAQGAVCVLGRNGAGKTTLLKLIAGTVDADKGTRSVQPGTKIVVLEQDPFFTGYATLMDFALSGADAPPRHEVEAIAGQLGGEAILAVGALGFAAGPLELGVGALDHIGRAGAAFGPRRGTPLA